MILALTLLACVPDDVDQIGVDDTGDPVVADDTGDSTGDPAADPALVGAWSSTGSGISDLLAGDPFNIVLVDADFAANGTYSVYSQDDAGTGADFAGTYSADPSTSPPSITLQQSSPYQATSVGIYQIDGTTLSYEVVQTVPDYGFVPPTQFGNTGGPGVDPGSNVATFERQ